MQKRDSGFPSCFWYRPFWSQTTDSGAHPRFWTRPFSNQTRNSGTNLCFRNRISLKEMQLFNARPCFWNFRSSIFDAETRLRCPSFLLISSIFDIETTAIEWKLCLTGALEWKKCLTGSVIYFPRPRTRGEGAVQWLESPRSLKDHRVRQQHCRRNCAMQWTPPHRLHKGAR